MTVNAAKTSSRLTARGAATRARIVAAAADLVDVHGAGGTSLDEVMARSGVSKSQLYHYFADKDALIREVIALQTQRVLGFQRMKLEPLDSISALVRWRDAIVAANAMVNSRGGCPVGSLANELADRSEPARDVLAESFEHWETLLADGLQTIVERSAFAADVDVHDIAAAMLAAIQGGLLLAKTTRNTRALELALDMAIDHVSRHLSADEAESMKQAGTSATQKRGA
ncbi:MAG TPA: TetR family transcriptional regulator [Devosiaceae bacterium]|jgi:AcrR family transcriptional regulator